MANVNFLSLDLSQPTDNKTIGNESNESDKEKSTVFSDLMEEHKLPEKSGKGDVNSGNESKKQSSEQSRSTNKVDSIPDEQLDASHEDDTSEGLKEEVDPKETSSTSIHQIRMQNYGKDDIDGNIRYINTPVSNDQHHSDTSAENIKDENEVDLNTSSKPQDIIESNQKSNAPDDLLSIITASGNTSTQLASQQDASEQYDADNITKLDKKSTVQQTNFPTLKTVQEQLTGSEINIKDDAAEVFEDGDTAHPKEKAVQLGTSTDKVSDNKDQAKSDIQLKNTIKSDDNGQNKGSTAKADTVKADNSPITQTLLNKDPVVKDSTKDKTYQDISEKLPKSSELSAAIRMATTPEKQPLEASTEQKDQLMRKYLETNSIPGKLPEDVKDVKNSKEAKEAEVDALTKGVITTSKDVNSSVTTPKTDETAVKNQTVTLGASPVQKSDDVKANNITSSTQPTEEVVSVKANEKTFTQMVSEQNQESKKLQTPTANNLDQNSNNQSKQENSEQLNKSTELTKQTDEQQVEEAIQKEFAEAGKNTIKSDAKSTINPLFDTLSQRETASTIQQMSQQAQAERSYENIMSTMATEVTQTQKHSAVQQAEVISIMRKDFTDAVKEKVMVMISQKLQQVDIQLDPPEFGNMQVRINLQNEQAVVSFIVQNQQAKEALDQNMDKLKNMLADSGVDVGEANVKQQSNQSSAESNHEHSTNNGQGGQSDPEIEQQVELKSLNMLKASSTGVDYYA